LPQDRRDIGAAVAGEAGGEHHLAGGFDRRPAFDLQLQAEASLGGFDPQQMRPIAHRYLQEVPIPAKIICPGEAGDAVDRGIGGGTMAGLEPGLEAERGNALFRSGQIPRRAQQLHPRGGQPDASLRFVRRGVDHRDFADAGAAQREGQRATGLPTADQHHVVVDARRVRDPVLRIRTDQAQGVQGVGIRVIGVGHDRHLLNVSANLLPARPNLPDFRGLCPCQGRHSSGAPPPGIIHATWTYNKVD
jgi:hypothetical protein